jgi:tetratricopeptide (TPR) repeat protein
MVVIHGEAGIGKTTMLRVLGDQAAACGARLVGAAAEELDEKLPFAAIANYLGVDQASDDPGLATVGRLIRGDDVPTRVATPTDLDFVVAEAVLALIDTWCARGPLVLAIDDLQWADPSSKALHATGGNPLYVTELVCAFLAGDTGADHRAVIVPSSLRATIVGRLRSLPAEAAQLVQLASVLGSGFTANELSDLVGRSPSDLLAPLEEASRSGMLVAKGSQLMFRHDVVRQALYDEIPESAREALHHQVGKVLAAASAPIERIGAHLLAGDSADAWLIGWVASNGPRLTARAPRLAADLLSPVLERLDGDADVTRSLHVAFAGALLQAGRPEDAEQAGRQVLSRYPGSPDTGDVRWIIVHATLNQGRPADAAAELEAALSDHWLHPAEACRFRALLSNCYAILGDVQAAVKAAERAHRERPGDEAAGAAACGLQAVARMRLVKGRVPEALRLTNEVIELVASRRLVADPQVQPFFLRASCFLELEQLDEAIADCRAQLRISSAAAGAFFALWVQLALARLLWLQGRWDDAQAEIATARGMRDNFGFTPHLDGIAPASLSTDRTGRSWRPVGLVSNCRLQARCHRTTGPGDSGVSFSRTASSPPPWQPGRAPGEESVARGYEYSAYCMIPDAVATALLLGQDGRAKELDVSLDECASRRDSPGMRRSAQFSRGLAEADVAAVLVAAGAYQTAGIPLRQAEAHETPPASSRTQDVQKRPSINSDWRPITTRSSVPTGTWPASLPDCAEGCTPRGCRTPAAAPDWLERAHRH